MSGTLAIAPARHPLTVRPSRAWAGGHPAPSRRMLRTLGTIGAAILAAAMLTALLVDPLDPFAPNNTHATPEMLAAWDKMMREG